MKKLRLIISIIFLSSFAVISQNVGVNNSNPQEALDVNGSINLTGEFKADGASGQKGQFLQADGNGAMQWAGPSEYAHLRVFDSSTTWDVPSGVTEITVEVWAGGGGGAYGGGGGAGSYVKASRSTIGVSSVTIIVGAGSEGSSGSASNGSQTIVIVGSSTATTTGGRGAGLSNPGYPSTAGAATSSWYNIIGIQGAAGNPTDIDYSERIAGSFVKISKGGNGGDSMKYPNSGGRGATSVSNDGSLYSRSFPTNGYRPGAGGGSGVTGAIAEDGAKGQVIIYWN